MTGGGETRRILGIGAFIVMVAAVAAFVAVQPSPAQGDSPVTCSGWVVA